MGTYMFLLLPSIFLLLSVVETQSVTVDFTTEPSYGLNPGSHVFLVCAWIGQFDDETDNILIVKNTGQGDSITLGSKDGLHSSNTHSHMKFITWYKESHTLWILINNISRPDYGSYTCNAIRQKDVDIFDVLAQQTIVVNILYPQSGDPLCAASPNKTIYRDGDEVTLQCTSDAGNPPVSLKWYQSSGTTLPKTSITELSSDRVKGSVTFLINITHNNAEFNCVRTDNNLSSSDVSSCLIGPVTVLNKTVSAMSLEDPAVVAGITIIPIFLLIAAIGTILFLVKSGRCSSSTKGNGIEADAIVKPDIKIEGVQQHGNLNQSANENNKPAPPRILAPNGVQYTAIQKDKPPNETAPKGKTYPKPPAYPRPPRMDDNDDEGAQYANSRQVNEVIEDAQYANSQQVNAMSRDGAQYANACPKETKSVAPPPGKIQNTNNNLDKNVYSNTLDVCGNSNATDAEKMEDTTIGLYANTTGNPRVPAPSQAPPPPPLDGSSKKTSEVEYADLDMVKPAAGSDCDSMSNSQPVAYASVKS